MGWSIVWLAMVKQCFESYSESPDSASFPPIGSSSDLPLAAVLVVTIRDAGSSWLVDWSGVRDELGLSERQILELARRCLEDDLEGPGS